MKGEGLKRPAVNSEGARGSSDRTVSDATGPVTEPEDNRGTMDLVGLGGRPEVPQEEMETAWKGTLAVVTFFWIMC